MSEEFEEKVSLRDYKAEILQILRSDFTASDVQEELLRYHENDIAAALAELQQEERQSIYQALDADTLAGIFEYVDTLSDYLEELEEEKRVEILSRVEPASAIAYLEELDKEEGESIIEELPEEAREEIALLTSYEKDEIGSTMSTDYISIRQGVGVRGAMNELIAQAAEIDNVSTIYVVDAEDVFVGAIDLKDLIRARAGMPLEDILVTSYPFVYANESVENCIERLKDYSEDSIPVLDMENKLRGVLIARDLAEMIEDQISEDYAKLGGLTAEEDVQEPLLKSIGKRLPWLIVLFGLGLVVSSIVGMFDHVVSYLPLLVSFQSLILGMAGNVGTQSLAVTIRSLMDENLTGKQKLLLVLKEARVGLCNGLILGSLSVALIGLYLYLMRGEPPVLAFSVSFCTGIALAVAMLLSSIFGTTIPIFFKKLNIDPAVASGPFITTINDLVAVVAYYGLAWLLLLSWL
ncbi:MAG: magnesium transporter [Clostridia bacterium]|nr:magnesium transporter [Clostridia bacterium]